MTDSKRLSRYFFFAFLFLLPLQTVYFLREVFVDGSKWQYGTIALYGTDILFIATLVLFVLSRPKTLAYDVSRIKYHAWLILLVFWAGLSIIWAPDQILAGYFFIKLLLALGVFFLAQSIDDEDTKTVIWVLVAAAVLQSLLGIEQFITQSTFALSLLGMSTHDVWQAGTSVLKNDTGRWLRAYGSFPHPNILGGFLAAVFVSGIAYFVSHIEELKRNQKFVFLVGLMVILLGLILTFSRTAWLGVGIGIATYFVFCIKYHTWGKQNLLILVTFGAAAIIFTLVLHETVFPRFDSAAIESEGSVSERVQSLRDAQVAIGEGSMLLGTGAGNFTAQIMHLQSGRPVWIIQPAHNVFVLIFAELGIIGVVLFVGFLGTLLYRLKENKNAIFAIALIALIPSLFLDHYLWTSHFGLFFFFLLAGFTSRR